MGKKYLNNRDKNIVLTIASLVAFMDDRAEEWEKLGVNKDQVSDARRARSFAQRVLNYIFEDLDQDEVKKVISDIGKREVVVRYKTQAQLEYQKMQELESVTPVETEDLLTIVDYALDCCFSKCKITDQDKIKKCPRRKVFIKYDIEPLHLDPPEGKCPYQYSEIFRTDAYKKDKPPADWDEFLAIATDTFVRKDTDYRHKYTRGLIKHGRVIWEWEVDKKLDRIRTWIERGELAVKGEGLNNAVIDAFNYTVLYDLYTQADSQGADPLKYLTERYFYQTAASQKPEVWVAMIEDEGKLIKPGEEHLKDIIFQYMGATKSG